MREPTVLVLNSDYTPLSIAPFRRAYKLLYKGKAELVTEKNNKIVTSHGEYPRPSIIRLYRYIFLPYKKVTLSRYNIYKRDEYRCLYCGSKDSLTLDHVIPKSKGGPNSWNNLVTCCIKCNVTKGDRTPEEAGMMLSHNPFTPNHLFFMHKMNRISDDWRPFLMMGDK